MQRKSMEEHRMKHMQNADLMGENHCRDGKGEYEGCDGDSPDAKHHLETQTCIDA